MTGQAWTEGDIRSRGYSHIPDEDWNRIFGKNHGNKIRDIPQMSDEEFEKYQSTPMSDEERIAKPSPWLEIINKGKSQDELDDEEVALAQKTCE